MVGLVWGLSDAAGNPIIMGILASDFDEKTEPFAIMSGFKNAVCCSASFLAGYLISYLTNSRILADKPPYIMLLLAGSISIIGYISSLFFKFKANQKSPESTEADNELTPLP